LFIVYGLWFNFMPIIFKDENITIEPTHSLCLFQAPERKQQSKKLTAVKKGLLKTILLAGFLVASLDIMAAMTNFYIQTRKDPIIVLRYIASAVFGKKAAYDGSDTMMPVWGLLFHFIIAYAWTTLFFLLYLRLKFMSANRALTGIVYGVFIWAMMTRVIIPLTSLGSSPIVWKQAFIAIGILILAISMPLSFIAYRYYNGLKSA